jgi:hypothetical protein
MQVSSAMTPGFNAIAGASSQASERTEKRENDGDGDDAKTAAASSSSRSISLNGQVTGQLIHATA